MTIFETLAKRNKERTAEQKAAGVPIYATKEEIQQWKEYTKELLGQESNLFFWVKIEVIND